MEPLALTDTLLTVIMSQWIPDKTTADIQLIAVPLDALYHYQLQVIQSHKYATHLLQVSIMT